MNASGSKCPFCGGGELRHLSAQPYDTTSPPVGKVSITECTNCVTAWQWPFQRSIEESVSEFDAAYTTQTKESYFDPVKRAAIGDLQRQFVAANTAGPGKLLDIGCGDGCFAKIMANHGWQVTGLDPALPLSIESGAIKAIRGTFSDLPSNEYYDVITIWDVVEHVENPLGLITEATRRLAPNGLLVIETGNYQSSGRITAGENWWNYQLDHRWYLAPLQLKQMMISAGLAEIHLADRVLRPWWKGQMAMPPPRLIDQLKSLVKKPLHAMKTLSCYRQLAEGNRVWGAWGGLEIMTMTGRRLI